MSYTVKELNTDSAVGNDKLIADFVISQPIANKIAKEWHVMHKTTVVVKDDYGNSVMCFSKYDFKVIVDDVVLRTENGYAMAMCYARHLHNSGARDVEVRLSNDSNFVIKKF